MFRTAPLPPFYEVTSPSGIGTPAHRKENMDKTRVRDHRIAQPAGDQTAAKRKIAHKPIVMVPFAEVETILSVLRDKTGDTNSAISHGCGYDSSTINQWKNQGEAPLRGKMAVLGFACELELHAELKALNPVTFDHDELMVIFSRFMHSASLVALDDAVRKRLVAKLAQALTE